MRRINLVLRTRADRRPSLSPWLAGAGGASLVALLAAVLVTHAVSRGEVEARVSTNAEQRAAIEAITARAADHPAVRAELGDLRQREEVVTGIQRRRVDASTRLLEISRVLTRGGAPTLRPVDIEQSGRQTWSRRALREPTWSTTWDPHRLWLTAMEEQEGRLVIRGESLSVDDVGELLRRLQVSAYFHDVRLERTEQTTSGSDSRPVQRFTLVARI